MKSSGPKGESRFGHSMTSLGDLNRDGFRDIAVGAPYDDQGSIYIFLGGPNGLNTEPSQVLFIPRLFFSYIIMIINLIENHKILPIYLSIMGIFRYQ